LVFTSAIEAKMPTMRMEAVLELLGNVTFIERPIRRATLAMAMRAALRARRRQYAAREMLVELMQQKEEAKRRAGFEQQLVGIVSHDLRNPVTAIMLSAASLLRREALSERERTLVSRIVSSADRANRMIRDLLDFTQARLSGGIRVERAQVNLHAIARDVVEEVAVAHPGREVRLQLTGDGSGEWDPDRLAQVLTNLLGNALSYSPIESEVEVAVRPEGVDDANGWLVLEVNNGGAPIPPEQLQNIFQPMTRIGATGARGGRSIGLGLYIVDQVVRAHGGAVSVKSQEASGTTFSVRLPRRPA
jgi:signal transduction histidine kinase